MNEMPHHPDKSAAEEAAQRPPEISADRLEAAKLQFGERLKIPPAPPVSQSLLSKEDSLEQPPTISIENIKSLRKP